MSGMTARVLIAAESGLYRWETGNVACEEIAGSTGMTFRGASTVDGLTWFASGGWSAQGLFRYVWGDALQDLGVIGTWSTTPQAADVLALSDVRCFVAYSRPFAPTYGRVSEYSDGSEIDHNPLDSIEVYGLSQFPDPEGNVYLRAWFEGDIWKWPGAGTTWTLHTAAPGAYPTFTAEDMTSLAADAIWLVGRELVGGQARGRVWLWNGATWSAQWSDARNGSYLYGVHALADDDIWACGYSPGPIAEILHFDGATWSIVHTVSAAVAGSTFQRIYSISATEVFATAVINNEARLYIYDGATWSHVALPGVTSLPPMGLCAFTGPTPPIVTPLGPYQRQVGVSTTSHIHLKVVDNIAVADGWYVEVKLGELGSWQTAFQHNGVPQFKPGWQGAASVLTPIAGGYDLVIDPETAFARDAVVLVRVVAFDGEGLPCVLGE